VIAELGDDEQRSLLDAVSDGETLLALAHQEPDMRGTATRVTKATLVLHPRSSNRAGFAVRQVTNDWTEGGITFHNAPSTGATLGMGRIAGDTAIVVILLGATLTNQGVGNVPVLSFFKGTGSTLTSYVYNNSPAGEGGAPDKAYAAAFVLLMIVILLNFGVDLISRRGTQWQTK